MIDEKKTERLTITKTGKIENETVNINYEQVDGAKPNTINANCVINEPETVNAPSPMMRNSTNINITCDSSGRKNTSVNGPKSITQVSTLIKGMETEIDVILNSFV